MPAGAAARRPAKRARGCGSRSPSPRPRRPRRGGDGSSWSRARESGDSAAAAPAPAQCVSAWNRDPSTVAFGVHNATAHGYSQVQVTRLADDGSALTGTDAGKCAVVFAATSLDPELGAAAQIRINGGWAPLTATGVDTARLAQLQSDAVELANADLQPDGTIVAR